MKALILIVFSYTCIFFYSCTNRNEKLINKAEACIEKRPDSARIYLQQVDYDRLSDNNLARYALRWTQATHKCRMEFEDDSIINLAVRYYQGKGGSRHELALAWFYKGIVHISKKQPKEAVQAFANSEHCFEHVEDNRYKALLHGHYGTLLLQQRAYNDALKHLKTGYEFQLKGDSIQDIVSACMNIALVYQLLDNKDSTLVYYNRGLAYREYIPKKKLYQLLQNYANFLVSLKQYEDAERLLINCKNYIGDSEKLDKSLGTIYYQCGQYEKALNYFLKYLNSSDSTSLTTTYLQLFRIYKEMGENKKAVHYFDLYRTFNDDLNERRKTSEIQCIPLQVEKGHLKEEIRNLNQKMIIIAVCIVLLVVGIILYYKNIRSKHQKELNEKKKAVQEEFKMNLYSLKAEISKKEKIIQNLTKQETENLDLLKIQRKNVSKQEQNLERFETEKKKLKKQLDVLHENLQKLEQEKELYEMPLKFLQQGGNINSCILLLQIINQKDNFQNSIFKRKDFQTLLEELLNYAYPGFCRHVGRASTNKNIILICYLIKLGITNRKMLAYATALTDHTISNYQKECKNIIEGFV